eukprot:TRINITY_DN22217_c0_g1_i1.p2 TRINITY_DN22217_c0_g1~~TRINITY_DN22217_c0_g1_i1.p2  ORF type:complete len:655 (+),score=218.75 TRINITY_DN22217_c0_g1_i1:90-1967(+)
MSDFPTSISELRQTLEEYEAEVDRLCSASVQENEGVPDPAVEAGVPAVNPEVTSAVADISALLRRLRDNTGAARGALSEQYVQLAAKGAELGKGAAELTAAQRAMEEELDALERCHNLPGVMSEAELLKRDPAAAKLRRSQRLMQRLRLELKEQARLAGEVAQAEQRLAAASAEAGWADGAPRVSSEARQRVSAANASNGEIASLQGVSYKPVSDDGYRLDPAVRLPHPLAIIVANLRAARAAATNCRAAALSAEEDGATAAEADVFSSLTYTAEATALPAGANGRKRDAAGDDAPSGGAEVALTFTTESADEDVPTPLSVTFHLRVAAGGPAEVLCHAAHSEHPYLAREGAFAALTLDAPADPAPGQPLWAQVLAGDRGCAAIVPPSNGAKAPGLLVAAAAGCVRMHSPPSDIPRLLGRRMVYLAAAHSALTGLQLTGLSGPDEANSLSVSDVVELAGDEKASRFKVIADCSVTLWVTVPLQWPARPAHVLPLPTGAHAEAKAAAGDPRCCFFAAKTAVAEPFAAAALYANQGLLVPALAPAKPVHPASGGDVSAGAPVAAGPAARALLHQLWAAAHYSAVGNVPAPPPGGKPQEVLLPDGFLAVHWRWGPSEAWESRIAPRSW